MSHKNLDPVQPQFLIRPVIPVNVTETTSKHMQLSWLLGSSLMKRYI